MFSVFAEYFKRKGVCALTVKELFDFVTDMSISSDNLDQYLDKAMEIASSRTLDELTQQQKVEEEVSAYNISHLCRLPQTKSM